MLRDHLGKRFNAMRCSHCYEGGGGKRNALHRRWLTEVGVNRGLGSATILTMMTM